MEKALENHIIKVLYQGLYKLLCTSASENPDAHKILTAARTGKAAYNVNGSTIHAIFNMLANRKLH